LARPPRKYLAPWLLVALGAATQASVNALSVIADRERVGRPIPAWEPWAWEGTSVVAWLMLAPLIFIAVERIRPPRITWQRALALHLLFTIALSLAHVLLMVAGRKLIYSVAGDAYPFALADEFLYEYRKDLVSYALIGGCFLLFERLVRTPPAIKERYRIEVRDGSRTRWLDPADVDWAQAAGNYVEIFGAFGTILHRRTLAALAEELKPHGFARIHRSRIVRKAAIAATETRSSGDFDVILASGATIGGSRRYRDELA
jgi:DNA-binding LytR/AlgR family response regulator